MIKLTPDKNMESKVKKYINDKISSHIVARFYKLSDLLVDLTVKVHTGLTLTSLEYNTHLL